eukprot:513503-Ditylum_brightwellii.AAC.1
MRAVSNAPSDAPPNYVEAVQRLRAVLYGKRKEKEEQEEVSPQRNPSQVNQNTPVKNGTPPPTGQHPNLIPFEADELDTTTSPGGPEPMPAAPSRPYNLRNRA